MPKDAINLLRANEISNSRHLIQSDDHLISRFKQHLLAANFIKAGAYSENRKALTAEQIEDADGYINYVRPSKYRVMLRTTLMRVWFPDESSRNRLVSLLRDQKIFLTGRQADTSSRQVSL